MSSYWGNPENAARGGKQNRTVPPETVRLIRERYKQLKGQPRVIIRISEEFSVSKSIVREIAYNKCYKDV